VSLPLKLAELHVYPIKSCAAWSLERAEVEPRGLKFDRRWMAVNLDGKFLTGRELPRLVGIRATVEGDRLTLNAPGLPTLSLSPSDSSERMSVTVWSSSVDAARVRGADDWLKQWLGVEATLVHMDQGALRPADPRYAQTADEVSFADGYPLLLTTRASLNDLNARLKRPVGMDRFRANVVIDGPLEAFAEDRVRRVRIGAVEFDNVKPCARCTFTTLDPVTLEFDPEREPLRTLGTYRRPEPGKILFGINLIPRSLGALNVGDQVEFLD
jgi:uncharacterized protein